MWTELRAGCYRRGSGFAAGTSTSRAVRHLTESIEEFGLLRHALGRGASGVGAQLRTASTACCPGPFRGWSTWKLPDPPQLQWWFSSVVGWPRDPPRRHNLLLGTISALEDSVHLDLGARVIRDPGHGEGLGPASAELAH